MSEYFILFWFWIELFVLTTSETKVEFYMTELLWHPKGKYFKSSQNKTAFHSRFYFHLNVSASDSTKICISGNTLNLIISLGRLA
jgi:hypothetical protein